MGLAYINPVNARENLYNITTIGPGSAPPRPHPGPTPPTGPGGPVDPGYSPPWAQIPVDPGYGIPETGLPGTRPPTPGGATAVVIPLPPSDPPVEAPEGLPEASTQVLIWFGPGTQPAVAWVQPYVSTGPVEPPPSEAQPK